MPVPQTFPAACYLCLLILAFGMLPPSVAHAATITVDTAADDTTATGNCTLREAVEAANTDTAVDACGAGSGADTITFDAALAGATIALTLGELVLYTRTTIDASGIGVILDAQGDSRVLFIENRVLPPNVRLIGLTITGGLADQGGGILNQGTLDLESVTVTGNEALNYGGGIKNEDTLRLSRSTVEANTAGLLGGGVMSDGFGDLILRESLVADNASESGGGLMMNGSLGTLRLIDSDVKRNTAETFGGAVLAHLEMIVEGTTFEENQALDGAGVYHTSTLTATNSVFRGNLATGKGGGLYNAHIATLENCVVEANEAVDGGGIYSKEWFASLLNISELVLINTRVQQNTATESGGGIHISGEAEIRYAAISGNAARTGGGLFHGGDRLRLEHSLVDGNAAGGNGGGLALRSDADVDQVTLTANTAVDSAGAIFVDPGGANPGPVRAAFRQITITGNEATWGGGVLVAAGVADVPFGGSILSGNAATSGPPDIKDASNGVVSNGYNVVGDTADVPGVFVQPGDQVGVFDPELGPLTDNGGFTATMLPLVGSPAVDASDASICSAFATDQRGPGFPRLLDGNGDFTAVCDVGAAETAEKSPTPGLSLLWQSPQDFLVASARARLREAPDPTSLDANGDGTPELVLVRDDPQGQPGQIEIRDGQSNTLLATFDAAAVAAVVGEDCAPFRGFVAFDDTDGKEAVFACQGALVIAFDGTERFATTAEQRFAGLLDASRDGRADVVVLDAGLRAMQIYGWIGEVTSDE